MTRYRMVWRANNRTVITHAFLDNGSSATFCAESLVRKLGVEGTKVKISLSTLEKKNSRVESYLIRDLVVSDLDENDFVSLPALYTRPEIPVCEEDIPTQEDVDQWPHLGGVSILHVDAEIGLRIVSDVPEATEMSQDERCFMLNAEKIQLMDAHYKIPLPFKNGVVLVPKSKSQALVQIGWLKKRLENDPKLCDDYKVFMRELIAESCVRFLHFR